MEPRVESKLRRVAPKVDSTTLSDNERKHPWLAFRNEIVTTGTPRHDYWGSQQGVVSPEGVFDVKFLLAMEQTVDYLYAHRGEPMMLVDTMIRDGGLVVVRANIGVVADDEDVLARGREVGFKNAVGKTHRLEANTSSGSLRLDHVAAYDSDFIPINGEYFVYGLKPESDGETTHRQEVIAGHDILSWITNRKRFGVESEGYEMFLGVLAALAGTGYEAHFLTAEKTFLRMLSKERRLVRMAEHVISEYEESTDNFLAAMEGRRAEADLSLGNIERLAGDLAYRLHRARNGNGSIIDSFKSQRRAPSPETRKEIISSRLALLDPGNIDLSSFTE